MDGRLEGWGLIGRCHQGHKIGPLVANDSAIALFDALCRSVPAGAAPACEWQRVYGITSFDLG